MYIKGPHPVSTQHTLATISVRLAADRGRDSTPSVFGDVGTNLKKVQQVSLATTLGSRIPLFSDGVLYQRSTSTWK